MEMASMAMANRLKELCEKKNISWDELADRTGIPKRKIIRIKMGATGNPNIVIMMKICDVLEVGLDEFVDTDEFREIRIHGDWR